MSPEWVPVTVSDPTGALVEAQFPAPPESVAIERAVDPTVKDTVPIAVLEETRMRTRLVTSQGELDGLSVVGL